MAVNNRHHIEIRISPQGRREAKFRICQRDGLLRYSCQAPHDPNGSAIPDNSLAERNHVLTVTYGAHPRGGTWNRIRNQLGSSPGLVPLLGEAPNRGRPLSVRPSRIAGSVGPLVRPGPVVERPFVDCPPTAEPLAHIGDRSSRRLLGNA